MAGAGYKLFNTGDVLTAAQVNTYLMEQTVMVFADAAARTTALSGVVSEGMISYLKDTNAVEVYNGSAWVASDDPNAIQNTIVDAKGDLIAASAADTPARLAVGSNDSVLVAASGETNGLKWEGAWTTYTPTLTNITQGNGTVAAKYRKVGKFVTVYFSFTMGSTSTMGTDPQFSLPFTSATGSIAYDAYFQDAGTATYVGFGNLGSSAITFYNNIVSGTYSSYASITATAPMTWTTNDFIRIYATYEAA